MMRHLLATTFILFALAVTSTPDMPPVSMMCNINVEAGMDILICPGGNGNMNGMVSGNYDDYEWSPTTGLDDPFDLNSGVSVTMPTIYTLTARGVGGNIVLNPGFETGTINPSTTAFTFVPPNNFAASGGGSYTIGTSATFGNFFGCAAHSGSYAMAWQGAGTAGRNLWCQTIAVNPNTDYKFSMWLMGVNIPFITSPPSVSVTINGATILAGAGTSTCAWDELTGTWNSGGAASATICITNTNGGQSIGVIDDISLNECCVVEDQVLVDVVDMQAIAQQAGPITCDMPSLILNGNGSSSGAGYTYLWTTSDGRITSGANTLNPTIEQPGEYTLTVFGPGGCEKDVTIIVEGNVTPPDIRTFTDILTCDDPNGLVIGQSSRPNLDFTWTGPNGFLEFSESFFTQTPGKYYLRVEDQYNCFAIDSVEVLDQRDTPELDILGDTISCGKDSVLLGSMSASWKLTYSWEGPNGLMSDSSSIMTGDSGTYILTVVDSNNCEAKDTFILIETDLAFNAFAIGDTINCSNPFATLTGFSDSSNVTFSWTGPNGFSEDGPMVSTADSGIYILTVTYDGLCTTTDTIEVIKEDGLPEWELIGDTITCIQDSVTLIGSTSTMGATISWIGPNGFTSDQSQIMAGDSGLYYLTVIGPNGCEIIDSFFVEKNLEEPTFTLASDTINCIRDSVEITATGNLQGSQYLWRGPNGSIPGSDEIIIREPGIYQLTTTGTNGCTYVDSIRVIGDLESPMINVENDTINCNQVQLNLALSTDNGQNIIAWNGPNGFTSDQSNPLISEAGVYNVIVTGENGCDTTTSINIRIDTIRPSFTLDADTINCMTPEVILSVATTDNGTYQWNGPSGFTSDELQPEVRDSGWYVLTFTNASGCSKTDSIFVIQTEATPNVTAIGDTLSCIKDSVIINGGSSSNGVNFSWTGPNGFTSDQEDPWVQDSGEYILTVTNMAGCSTSVSVVIGLDNEAPEIVSLDADAIPCDSTETTLRSNVNGQNLTFRWTGPGGFTSGDPEPRVSNVGWYTLVVTGENGCMSIDSAYVVAQDIQPGVLVEADTLTCINTEANLMGSSPDRVLSYLWEGPNGFMSSDSTTKTTTPGTYSLTVRDANGCSSSLVFTVEENVDEVESTVVGDTIWCEDIPAQVSITTVPNQSTIQGTDPMGSPFTNKNFTTSIPGVYQIITLHPESGCLDTVNLDLALNTDTIRDLEILAADIGCADSLGSISVLQVNGGQGPFTYSLNNGGFSNVSTFGQLNAGNYNVQVADRHGCITQQTENIDQANPFSFGLPADQTIQAGQSVTIDVNTNATMGDILSITWSPAINLSCTDCLTAVANPDQTTTYVVEMTDVNGCTYLDEITIFIEDSEDIYVPNVFSPNGDNINDIFMIHGDENATILSLQIFDRWGEQVFFIENGIPGDEAYGWDGTMNGERLNPAVFVYVAKIMVGSKEIIRKGGITVL